MTPQDFRFSERLRVRWAEVDMQKIVFNGHYLMYIDTAVAGYWRALALPYEDTMQQVAGDLFVRKAALEYHASAEYDDQLDIGIRCDRVGTSSITFAAAAFRAGELLVSGELVYVFADPVARRSQPVPEALRDVFLGYEAGQAMIEVRVGDWGSLGTPARALRDEVFVAEQHIPADLACDAADDAGVHAVAFNRLGMALGAGRLLTTATPGVSQIGRMAVRRGVRGGQVGRGLLNALIDTARTRGDGELMLHAQASAIGFYLRAGFSPRGPAFVEAGISHQDMVLPL